MGLYSRRLIGILNVVFILVRFAILELQEFSSDPQHQMLAGGGIQRSSLLRHEVCANREAYQGQSLPVEENPPPLHSNNMLERITDDLNFLLNGTTTDMMTFTPAHHLNSGKQKLATIQETMVGISEDVERRPVNPSDGVE